jgi:hypothetical protein
MHSDFELADYEVQRRAAMQNIGAALMLGGVVFAGLAFFHLAPAWLTLIVLLAVLAYGIIYPVRWRRKHHPFRTEAREQRYSMALMLCRPVMFVSAVVAACCYAMAGVGPQHTLNVMIAFIFISATFPITLSYKS